MQTMTAKRYLKHHEVATLRLQALERTIAELYSKAFPAQVTDGEPPVQGNVSDRTGSLAVKIADMRLDAEALWYEQQIIRREIERTIFAVEDPNQIRVLKAKYIDLKGWSEIADEMDKTERTVQRIHGEALVEVEKLLEEQ